MRFLYNVPAIMHCGALIIGDTHFGMEAKLRRRGIYNAHFTRQLFERIKKLLQETKAKKLIMLGDVKEELAVLDPETERTISGLSMLAELIIVRGNHDGGIRPTVAGETDAHASIVPAEGFVYRGVALVHGHSWPGKELMKCKTLICAHQHPCISFTDSTGRRHSEPVWAIAEADGKRISQYYNTYNPEIRLVLMPSFNPLVGSALNFYANKHLGPLLNKKLFKADDALVFRLDGNSLGKLKNLKK